MNSTILNIGVSYPEFACVHPDPSIVDQLFDPLCPEHVSITLNRFIVSLLLPKQKYRLVPVERFNPRNSSDEEWALALLRRGKIDLTSFTMSLSKSRYDFWPHIIGPSMQVRPMVFYAQETFTRRPNLGSPVLESPFALGVAIILAALHFVGNRSPEAKSHPYRAAHTGMAKRLIGNTLEGTVIFIFTANIVQTQISSTSELLVALENNPDVSFWIYSADALRTVVRQDPKNEARWLRVAARQAKVAGFAVSLRRYAAGERVVVYDYENSNAILRRLRCNRMQGVLKDQSPITAVSYTSIRPIPRMTDPIRTIVQDKARRVAQGSAEHVLVCDSPPPPRLLQCFRTQFLNAKRSNIFS